MKAQLKKMGISYDWDRELATCDPSYYKWEQLIFVRMLERGLAYRRRSTVNWCPGARPYWPTSRSRPAAAGGATRRSRRGTSTGGSSRSPRTPRSCSNGVTAFRLARARHHMQKNWIGRSEGAEFELPVVGKPELKVRVFTTRPDTAFG
jgi:leucyl-tRNA synthetase